MIRQKIFQYHAKRWLQNCVRQKQFVNYANASSILLLYEVINDDSVTNIKRLAQLLQADNKCVTLVGHLSRKENLLPTDSHFIAIDRLRTSIFGKPDAEILSAVEQPFDLLIDLTNRPILPLQYVVLHANARCKCGGYLTKNRLFDLVVDQKHVPNTNETALFENILHYLKTIQQTNYGNK